MDNLNASNYWERIKELLSIRKQTFEWLCQEAGVSTQGMRNRIYKQRVPGMEDTMKFLEILQVSFDDFYSSKSVETFAEGKDSTKQSENHLVSENTGLQIPVYDQVFSAGFGQFVPENEIIDGYITVPDDLKKYNGHLAASRVRGDSMEPTIHDGDTFICDDLGYKEDGVYVIIYRGKGFVKRLQQTSIGVKIISDNPAYSPMEVSEISEEQLKVIGKVHYILHKL